MLPLLLMFLLGLEMMGQPLMTIMRQISVIVYFFTVPFYSVWLDVSVLYLGLLLMNPYLFFMRQTRVYLCRP